MFRAFRLFVIALLPATPGQAHEEGSQEDAVATVHETFAMAGAEAAFRALAAPTTEDVYARDFYRFIYDVHVANGARPMTIGTHLMSLAGRDGYCMHPMIAIARGNCHGDDKLPSPVTAKIGDKSSAIARLGDAWRVDVGVWRPAS